MELEKVSDEIEGKKYLLRLLHSSTPVTEQSCLPEHTLIFTHIPRTAGTTLDMIIRAVAGLKGARSKRAQGTVYNQYLGSEKGEASEFILERKDSLDDVRFIIGHVPYGIHEKLNTKNPVYGVVLRDPVRRVMSQIQLGLHKPTSIDSDEIASLLDEGKVIDNCQVRMVAGCNDVTEVCDNAMLDRAIANLDNNYSYVGLQENFVPFLKSLVERERWPSILYLDRHASPAARVEVTKSTEQRLDRLIEFDKVLYAHAKARFVLTGEASVTDRHDDSLEESSDIAFCLEPHTIMGRGAGVIPTDIFDGIRQRLAAGGTIIKDV